VCVCLVCVWVCVCVCVGLVCVFFARASLSLSGSCFTEAKKLANFVRFEKSFGFPIFASEDGLSQQDKARQGPMHVVYSVLCVRACERKISRR